METGTTPVEDTPATQSTESNIVQINSIYIDLKFPPEENETDCSDHAFSIRGYAAEMRKKNPKASFPFASTSLNNMEEQLPLMQVPNFRWWRCPECRKKIEEDSAGEETPVHSNCCIHPTPSNMPSNGDATMILSTTQPLPIAQLSEGIRNVDINAPPSHQKTNDAETKDASAIGGDAAPVGLVIDKAGPTRDEGTSDETGDGNGLTEQENNDGTVREIHREFQQPADGCSAEIPFQVKLSSADVRFELIPHRTGDGTHNMGDVASARIANSSGVAPVLVEESGTGSEQNKRHENSSGVSRRRRKVRSLTELLGDKGKLRSDVLKADVPSINRKVVGASGSSTVLSEDQAPHEDIGSGNKSPQNKRKMPQEEPEGNIDPPLAGPDGCISEAVSARTVTVNAACSFEAQEIASSSARLQISHNTDHSNCKTEKTPVLVKRKHNQLQVHDKFSPRPSEQSSSKHRTNGVDLLAATENNFFRSLGTSSAARKRYHHSRNSQSPQVLQREKGQCAQITSSISKSQPLCLNGGLDLSLNSFAGKIISSGNKEKSSPSKSIRGKNDLHSGQYSLLPAPETDRLRKKSQVWDLNEVLARNSNNLVQKRNLSLTKETRSQMVKTSEVEGRPQEINIQSDNMGSNTMAQGSPDDVPMEIVELMAKNQYERGLPDAGSNSFQPIINNNMGRFAEVQAMGPLMFTKGFPALTSFSTANARSGLTMGANAMNYPQMNRKYFEAGNAVKSQVSILDMFPQNQDIFSRGMQCPPSVRNGSHRSERAEIGASSAVPNMSFGLGIQQKYPSQNPVSQHRGITISDIKADEIKKRQEAHIIFSRPRNSELISMPMGPVDPYVNDSIPAMQLLSLMNGTSPGMTFNVGSSKPFAPCDYHPRYCTTERRDMLSGPLLQRQSQLGAGTFGIGEGSGRSPGKRPFAFSGPWEEDLPYLARYTSGIPYTGPTSTWGSDSIPYLHQHLGRRSISTENGSITEEAQQLRLIPRQEQICVTNQNPAEFTLPDSEAFTICWKDLKSPKRKYPRGNPGNGVKRQRVAKPKAGKEQPLVPSS